MKVYSKKQEIASAIEAFKTKEILLGLVPTMGALHDGHLELVKKALKENNKVVVSIFVNPTQFNNQDDLIKYPRTLEKDISLLQKICKDNILVFAPEAMDIYDNSIASQKFDFDGLDLEMEGKFREGHFDGVGTIVKRLFDIIKPDNAYFGEKDYQQLTIIKKLVHTLNLPVKIVGCEIFREANGLAMSSRNSRLNTQLKTAAPFIYETLKTAKEMFGTKSASKIRKWVKKQFDKNALLELEYFTIADTKTLKPLKRKSKKKQYRAFIAVHADDIRLIDNIAL